MTHTKTLKQGLAIVSDWIERAGAHYRGPSLDHTDWLDNFLTDPTSYYLGCASKYISRFPRTKNMNDLLKAVHYLLYVVGKGQ